MSSTTAPVAAPPEYVAELRDLFGRIRSEYDSRTATEAIAVALISDRVAEAEAAVKLIRALPDSTLADIGRAEIAERHWRRQLKDPSRVIQSLLEVSV